MKPGKKPIDRMGPNGTRWCITCKDYHPLDDFPRSANRPDGYYPECKKVVNERSKKRYRKNPGKYAESSRRYAKKIRKQALNHYGHKCACCGESRYEFLAIDHIYGGGLKHKREVVGGRHKSMASWLVKNDFPHGFQILCHNCNNAKGWYGECPHVKEQRKSA